jgi:anti-anti-sigma factor
VRLQILVRQCNDVTILDLTGKATIDASEGELLSKRLRALTDNGKHKLLLNLANLTQVDSTGISAIVESYLCLQRQDGELKLLGPRGRVLEVLSLFGLLDVIPSFIDERQALASSDTAPSEILEATLAQGAPINIARTATSHRIAKRLGIAHEDLSVFVTDVGTSCQQGANVDAIQVSSP